MTVIKTNKPGAGVKRGGSRKIGSTVGTRAPVAGPSGSPLTNGSPNPKKSGSDRTNAPTAPRGDRNSSPPGGVTNDTKRWLNT